MTECCDTIEQDVEYVLGTWHSKHGMLCQEPEIEVPTL